MRAYPLHQPIFKLYGILLVVFMAIFMILQFAQSHDDSASSRLTQEVERKDLTSNNTENGLNNVNEGKIDKSPPRVVSFRIIMFDGKSCVDQ